MRALLFLVLALLATSAAHAQVYTPRGFSGSIGLLRSGITLDSFDDDGEASESGFGGAITLEYGFNDLISIYLNGDGADVEDATLGHGDLGVRLHLRANPQIFPFAQVGLTGLSVTGDEEGEDIELTGGALSIGAGAKYFFNPRLALNLSLTYATGEFTEVKVGRVTVDDLDLDATTTRFGFGIQYYFTK